MSFSEMLVISSFMIWKGSNYLFRAREDWAAIFFLINETIYKLHLHGLPICVTKYYLLEKTINNV